MAKEDDDKTEGKEQEAGGSEENKDEGSTGDKGPETLSVKVDGVMKEYALEEATKLISESSGAQQRFEEASALAKKAGKGIRLAELSTALQKGAPSQGEVEEFLGLMGTGSEDIAKMIGDLSGTGKEKDKKDKKKEEAPSLVSLEQLDPRLKAIIEGAEKADLSNIRQGIEDQVKKEVDKDGILGKMVGELPDDVQGEVKNVLYDMAIESVKGRILGREPFGTDMISSVLQTLRARIKTVGTPIKAAGQAPVLGLSPAGTSFSPEILANEPIKRLTVDNPQYETNAVDRFQQMLVRAFKKSGK